VEEEIAAIRCLAEYQHYQSVASILEGLAEESSRLYPRGLLEVPEREERESLSHVSLLSLVAALEHALQNRFPATMEIEHEEYSLREGLDHLRSVLQQGAPRAFLDVFPRGASKLVVVVVFLGLLELIRLGEILVREHHGHIWVYKEGGAHAE
jgi:segregation and condensation protein A